VPFTIASINQGNEAGVTNVSITVPAAPIFNETKLIPGESVGPEDLEVTNNGDENVLYYIFADWKPAIGTTPAGAQILADRLNILIEDDQVTPTVLYNGPISGLIEQPSAGRELAAQASETLKITVSLPDDVGNIVQNLAIEVDLIFVAQLEEEP
jgi:hypothetical protein